MSQTDQAAGAKEDTAPFPNTTYAWWVVFVLCLALIVSYVDRHIVSILVEPIKRDLGISDARAGWLFMGFAIFHALAGLPLARFADRKSRRFLISLGIIAWSAMTMACGMARSFGQLMLARIGVGVGEATLAPAATSLIGDYFPRERVPLAISVFHLGAVLGSGLAFLLGGTVVEFVSNAPPVDLPILGTLRAWQLSFIYVGLPGVLVVFLMATIREPVRRLIKNRDGSVQAESSLRDLLAFYRLNWSTFTLHHLGVSSLNLFGWAFVFWTPTFFLRVHGVPAGEAAQMFGAIFLVFGPMGTLSAPLLARYLGARGRKDANMLALMAGAFISIPAIISIQILPDLTWIWLLYAPASLFVTMPFGLAQGSLTVVTPPHMRAQVAAVYWVVISVIGMGAGPVVAGLGSDLLFTGDDGLRYSLITVTAVFGPLGIGLLWLGRKPYARSLTRADTLHEAEVPVT